MSMPLWYHVELHALANATKRLIWWKRLGNTFILQHSSSHVASLGLNMDQKWDAIFYFILCQRGLELMASWLSYHIELHALANATKRPIFATPTPSDKCNSMIVVSWPWIILNYKMQTFWSTFTKNEHFYLH
jgi:hypothetical protein